MADVPHLLKSIRNCFLTQSIILPDSIVRDANLWFSMANLRQIYRGFFATGQGANFAPR